MACSGPGDEVIVDVLHSQLEMACEEILSAIHRLRSNHLGPVVVAVDGGSGSGKSVLSAWVAERTDAALVHVDDFFAADIPERFWETATVEEKLERVFDWHRLRKCVILPLLAGEPARWYPFDFVSGQRPDGTYGMQSEPTVLEPAGVILLDGAYSSGPGLSDLVDLSILVEVPVAERHARLALREDAAFLSRWHELWDPLEAYYFNHVRPPASFDTVVRNA